MKRSMIFAILAIVISVIAGLLVYLYGFFYPDKYVKLDNGEYVNITVAKNTSTFPITTETRFEIEHFYVEDKRTLVEQINEIPILLGCDKEGVERYLNEYMNHLSAEEREEGLSDFQLVSYNKNVIRFRKIYSIPDYEGYYAKSFNGYIVIMNGDEKTVYDYTQISVHLLPEDLQEEVRAGYYLEDETALYNFLETYSS